MKIVIIIFCIIFRFIYLDENYLDQNKNININGFSCPTDTIECLVYKIDSINNFDIIYARNKNSIFKIVSKKSTNETCNKIRIGEYYKIMLHSIFTENGTRIIPSNSIIGLSGWRIDSNTYIRFEGDSIRDIFIADNIKGLCIEF